MGRKRLHRPLVRLAAGMLCLATARASFASDLDWKLSTSLNYDSGKYGTSTRSSSLYVPLTVERYWGDWKASLTMPYLSQTSNGQVTNVGGRPLRVRGGTATTTTATTTRSGPGDAVIRGGYDLMHDDPQPFDLTATAKVKIPTADKNKGLGTGQFDEGLGLEFGKLVVPGWTLLADAYYTVIGNPPGTHLNNEVAVDFGFMHPVQTNLTLTVLLEGSNALVSGEPAPVDLRGILGCKLSERGRLFGGILLGLSRGNADYGFSLGGSYRF